MHAVDVVPTLYDLLGVEPSEVINGFVQSPIEGESFTASLTDPEAPGRRTQFYSMLGQRALFHEGWLANTVHPTISGWSEFESDTWELYHLATDRSQTVDVAAQNPEKLRELVELWRHDAGVYKALPLDDRTAVEVLGTPRPQAGTPQTRYRYLPGASPVPESVAVNIRGRSYTVATGVVVDAAPDGPSPVGTLTLYCDEAELANRQIRTQPGKFGLGSGLCVGRAMAPSPDPDCPAPSPFTGGLIEAVVVDVSGDEFVDHHLEVQSYLARD